MTARKRGRRPSGPRGTRPPDTELELERLRARVEQLSQLLALLPATGAEKPALDARPPVFPGGSGVIDESAALGIPLQDVSTWRATVVPAEALTPPSGFAAQSLSATTVPALAVHVFGLRGDALERIVGMVAKRQQQSRDFRPVFLTDSADLGPFRKHGFACEHFPPALYGRADRAPRFTRRTRIAFLQRKWAFAGTLDLSVAAKPVRDSRASAGSAAATAKVRPAPINMVEAVAMIRESGLFDEAWYLASYPDAAGRDPIRHYLEAGAARGFDPGPAFRTTYYVRQLMRVGRPKSE